MRLSARLFDGAMGASGEVARHVVAAAFGAALTHGAHTLLDDPGSSTYQALETTIETEEDFRSHPYKDSRGYLTLGFGTNLDAGITIDEGRILLQQRLDANGHQLAILWPAFADQPVGIQAALVDMSYQLGAGGVLEFKKMLSALERNDYKAAAAAALDSAWARETPARAKRVAGEILKG